MRAPHVMAEYWKRPEQTAETLKNGWLQASKTRNALMLVRGKPLTVIGEQLSLSPKTVSTYKQRLMEKLHVDHVLGLAHLMTAHGLLDSPERQVGA